MKITLICPNFGSREGYPVMAAARMEPLALGILAGLTPEDHTVKVFDERIEEIDFSDATDLVGITVDSFGARRAYQIADRYRAMGIQVVLGGFHVSLLPDEAAAHADCVVIGEAEETWPLVVADAASGRLQTRYKASGRPGLVGVFPRRDVFAGKKYLPVSLVQFNRGCPYVCDFCSVSTFYQRSQNQRPVEDVVAEIKAQKSRFVLIVDDNIVGVPEKAKELFRALIPLKIRWVSQASIDLAQDPELIDLARRSGCMALIVGLESLNPDNLNLMRKRWTVKDGDIRQGLDVIRRHGIMVYATFVFGYEHDTHEVFDRTVEFALEQKFLLANFNHLMPFPGTSLDDRLRKEGRLLYDPWWQHPDYRFGHAAYMPGKLTPDELTAGCMRARSRFASASGVMRRALDFRANLRDPFHAWIYFLANQVSRHDIFSKQGIVLGRPEPALEPVR